MPPPLLSVVIPTHNRRDLTVRAVRSVLAQDGTPALEVIVVDDGSTDGTPTAVRAAFHGEPRVQVYAYARGHASAARNRGFALARGEFVAFLDSDDFWLPGVLHAMLAAFAAQPELAFVSVDGATLASGACPALPRVVAGDSPGWSHPRFRALALASTEVELPNGRARLLAGDYFPAIVFGDLFYLSAMLIRRKCAAAAGPFNERFRYYNDWEFFARLCLQGHGGYLDFDGFRRDSGRADQISRRKPPTSLARRHLFILRSLRRRAHLAPAHRDALDCALGEAHYSMARRLATSTHARWAKRYLLFSLGHRHRVLHSLALLAGYSPPRERALATAAGRSR